MRKIIFEDDHVQTHHALIDGKHVGEYYEHFGHLAANPSIWIE